MAKRRFLFNVNEIDAPPDLTPEEAAALESQEPPWECELSAEELEDYLVDTGVITTEGLLEYNRRDYQVDADGNVTMRAPNDPYTDGTAANIEPEIDGWNNVNRKAYKELASLKKYVLTHPKLPWLAKTSNLKQMLETGLNKLPEPYGEVIWQHYAEGGHTNSFKALANVYCIHYKTLERTAQKHLQTLRHSIFGAEYTPELLNDDDSDSPELPDSFTDYTEGNEPEGAEHLWREHMDSRKLHVWHEMGRCENRKREAWYANREYPVRPLQTKASGSETFKTFGTFARMTPDQVKTLQIRIHEVYATDRRFHLPFTYDRSTEVGKPDYLITNRPDPDPDLEDTAIYGDKTYRQSDTLLDNALTEWPTKYATQGLTEKSWYEAHDQDFTEVEFPERFRGELEKVWWGARDTEDGWSDDLYAQRWHGHDRCTQILS